MFIGAINTSVFKKGDSLIEFLLEAIGDISLENSVVAITTKIVSLAEGSVVKKSAVRDKIEIIKEEADFFLEEQNPVHSHIITIKHGILIPSAGIDESNSQDSEYILYPRDPMLSAEKIWQDLKENLKVKNLGVMLVDSHTTPMRMGVTGVALSWCGFSPIYSYVGEEDLFGRKLKYTKVNILDGLAAGAVLSMGEGSECRPISIIKDISNINFTKFPPSQEEISQIHISMHEDIYFPLFKNCKWVKYKKDSL